MAADHWDVHFGDLPYLDPELLQWRRGAVDRVYSRDSVKIIQSPNPRSPLTIGDRGIR